MSSVSVVPSPGPEQVAQVKPANTLNLPASSPPAAVVAASGTAAQFHSPQLEIDPLLNQVIVQFRDGQSGAPEYQIPSKSQLLLYQGTQTAAATAPAVDRAKAV
ncbi:MAG: hypothetical protein QOJ54_1659 [Aliidongia sp.]|jgi:hypothetical protein|nr:hypothetical protein [Aliidongia sp.]